MVSLQKQLKTLRQRRAISQEELARLIGVSVRTVVRWEQGYSQPSPLALARLQALNLGQTAGGRHGISL